MSPWSDAYCEPETIIYDDIDPSPARGLTLRTRADSSATPGIIDVSLSWQPATDVGSGVAEYRIYRDSSDGRWQLVGRTDITRLVDDSLAVFGLASNVYRYTVHPVDGVGNEQKSQEQIEYLQIVPCPDSVWASSKQYLSWNGVDLVDAFFAECSYDRVYLGTAWMNNLPDAARAFISSPDSGSCHFLTDMNFVSHSVIYFHVKAIKGSDESAWSEVVTFGEGGVASSDGNAVPREFELSQNYPNPFNPVTRIIFRLPEAGRVALRIFNIKGELVRTLVDRDLPAGEYSLDWDSSDESGRAVASGVYFYQIRAGQMSAARKMLLVR